MTLVRSSLEYCGAIWNPSVKDEIDSLEICRGKQLVGLVEPAVSYQSQAYCVILAGIV